MSDILSACRCFPGVILESIYAPPHSDKLKVRRTAYEIFETGAALFFARLADEGPPFEWITGLCPCVDEPIARLKLLLASDPVS